MSDGGKGDKRRPEATPGAYAEGWDRLFGAGVDERRQGADLAIPVNGSVNVPVLDSDSLAGSDLTE